MSWSFLRGSAWKYLQPGYHRRGGNAFQSPSADFIFNFDLDETLPTDESTDSDEDADFILFGSLRGNVVGLRYYTGVVNNNEMVSLKREPNNPYDRNAVRVNNVNGDQVGHIKRELAVPLAYIMDNKLAKVEGVVPYGSKNYFNMPVMLSFWGKEENKRAVLDALKRHGMSLALASSVFEVGFVGSGRASQSQPQSQRPGTSFRAPTIAAVQMTTEQLKSEFDKLFEDLKEDDKTQEMEPADAVVTPLLPHQKQALAWMVSRENSKDLPPFWEQRNNLYYNLITNFAENDRPENVLGGILADDMGMGKTLSTIALILTNFHNGKPLPVERSVEYEMCKEDCHIAVAKQEADGPKRKMKKLQKGKNADIELIPELKMGNEFSSEMSSRPKRKEVKKVTYKYSSDSEDGENSVSSKKSSSSGAVREDDSFAAALEASSVPSKKKMKKKAGAVKDDDAFAAALVASSVPSKRKIKKGPSGVQKVLMDGSENKSRATLIVCPLSVLSNWLDQLEQHVSQDVKLQLYLYYGLDRITDPTFLAEQDIVLTTYTVLGTDFRHRADSPLHKVKWLRVILDEGHTIRNSNCLQTKAAINLMAQRRWVLTGTPIQNSLKDLWSLLSFFKLKPFTEREWWYRTIERPVTIGDHGGLKRLQALIKNITLRRTKTSKVKGKPVLVLPERKVFVQYVELSSEERRIYDAVKNDGRNVIGRYVNEGSVLTHYADVLAVLVRLRQLCCHSRLFRSSDSSTGLAATGSTTPEELREKLISKIKLVLSLGSDEECAICLDSLTMPVITHCVHVFCKPCICQVIHSEKSNAKCPLCRSLIRTEELLECPSEETESSAEEKVDKDWVSSSKVDALMHSLIQLRKKDRTVKSLIVSQFTTFLALLERPLRESGFVFTRLVGSMTQKKRTEAINSFQSTEPGSPTIMLLSLKAGGVGLNLTAASQVFLMDPAWNPAAEDQCFDRCHRLGQKREVIITKFIVKNSVEENMVKIQNKKRELAAGAFGANKQNASEMKQARIDEIRTLIDL
ncbi:helicase-like transcription factor [Protopterus annectens]|uniref:helicase-like transcription factor n=1 Tax=Protopterus annectens TaxID=7888 RepID=UPI001CFBDEEF|nr:helicase-like transcription factor [Protopterus annectens]